MLLGKMSAEGIENGFLQFGQISSPLESSLEDIAFKVKQIHSN